MNRIDWIDTAKGYGMLCVIIGHLGTPGISAFVYTFHMPLFFFLSGFLFHHQKKIVPFILRKTKSLVIPYFCLAIPVIFNELFIKHGFSFQTILSRKPS